MKLETCIFDSETLGLHGPMVILQYKFDDEPAVLYNPWLEPVDKTIRLIERMVLSRVVAHNITFDWQKIQSFYNAIRGLALNFGGDKRPIDYVDEMVHLFYTCRNDFCLKPPQAVCTLMLCQKQIGGAASDMKEIRVRKIPAEVGPLVAHVLNKHTKIPEIMFARRKTERDMWNVGECSEKDAGDDWCDVVLKFAPSNSLKDVCKLVLGADQIQKLGKDLRPDEYPVEEGYAPYCNLLDEGGYYYTPKPKNGQAPVKRKLWPLLLHDHIRFWNEDPKAVKYAMDDIVLLLMLYEHLGRPETDFDAEIGCQVASVRMAGFSLDLDKLEAGIEESTKHNDAAEVNVDSPKQVKQYIMGALDELEAFVVAEGCNKKKLEWIIRNFTLTDQEECGCNPNKDCARCDNRRVVGPGPMPVVRRAQHILDVRLHRKRLQLYNKLAVSRHAFPSFRVIGTKSGRMSGADGLNYHGIDSSQSIREVFTLADPDSDWVVCGGDFDSQELAIMAATMKDAALDHDIRTGRSLHAVFASSASGLSYDQIMKNKAKDGPENVWYGKAKACVYALSYGAASFKIAEIIGCSEEEAEKIILKYFEKYVHMLQVRKQITSDLSCLHRTEHGLELTPPKMTYIDSCFGFRRAFDVEYRVIGAIVEAMSELAKIGRDKDHPMATLFKSQVVRKKLKGSQTVGGVISSALYGATFSIQNKIIRAALNHQIQSAGRTITLRCQHRIWDLQPVGVHPFRVKLMSVHDELATTSSLEMVVPIREAVREAVDELCKDIPLLGLGWASDVGSWYGVKSTKEVVQMGFKR